jgi:hypothetical protein
MNTESFQLECNLDHFSLADICQLVATMPELYRLDLRQGGHLVGAIWMRGPQVLHAATATTRGQAALQAIFAPLPGTVVEVHRVLGLPRQAQSLGSIQRVLLGLLMSVGAVASSSKDLLVGA